MLKKPISHSLDLLASVRQALTPNRLPLII
jgi:hypothetical protein